MIHSGDRKTAITLIAEAVTNGARKFKACEVLDINVRTLQRWRLEEDTKDKRKNAKKFVANKLSQEERDKVMSTLNSEEFRDLPACKVVPKLADQGLYYASESTCYRLLREENQLVHRQKSKSPKRNRPKACRADGPNRVWSWDITYLPTQVSGIYFYLYLIMDIFSRKIVGWSVHEVQSSEYASLLIKQACLDEKINLRQITLHSDNGTPMKGATMLATLQTLGVMPSFSRPSVSDDNPFSESLFRTVKYHPDFPALQKFEAIEGARAWCENFDDWYNMKHLHSALKFVTPHQRHTGEYKKNTQEKR